MGLSLAQAALSQLKAEAAEAFNHGLQSDYNQLAVGAAEAEKQVMAIIEEFGAARKSGFMRSVNHLRRSLNQLLRKCRPWEHPQTL